MPKQKMKVPEVADVVEVLTGTFKGQTFRVTGFTKASPASEIAKKYKVVHIDDEGCIHTFCKREEATHICGAGICGCLENIDNVKFLRIVDWDSKLIEEEKRNWETSFLIGEHVS